MGASQALKAKDVDAIRACRSISTTTPDWHPGRYPPMPELVATGGGDAVVACAGTPRAERTGPAGERGARGRPYEYIVQRMAD